MFGGLKKTMKNPTVKNRMVPTGPSYAKSAPLVMILGSNFQYIYIYICYDRIA